MGFLELSFMKKILCFIALFLAIVGVIGGIGYALYCKAYVIAFSVFVVGGLAYPQVKRLYLYLTE